MIVALISKVDAHCYASYLKEAIDLSDMIAIAKVINIKRSPDHKEYAECKIIQVLKGEADNKIKFNSSIWFLPSPYDDKTTANFGEYDVLFFHKPTWPSKKWFEISCLRFKIVTRDSVKYAMIPYACVIPFPLYKTAILDSIENLPGHKYGARYVLLDSLLKSIALLKETPIRYANGIHRLIAPNGYERESFLKENPILSDRDRYFIQNPDMQTGVSIKAIKFVFREPKEEYIANGGSKILKYQFSKLTTVIVINADTVSDYYQK